MWRRGDLFSVTMSTLMRVTVDLWVGMQSLAVAGLATVGHEKECRLSDSEWGKGNLRKILVSMRDDPNGLAIR